jgi:hypothetical protein
MMSDDWVRRALARKVKRKGSRGSNVVVVSEPDEKLVYVVKFAIGMTVCFSAVEIAHLVVLHMWNSEVFAAITGLSGTVMGIFVGSKS